MGMNEYRAINIKIEEPLFINNDSSLHKNNNRWIVFSSVIYTSYPFMYGITKIKLKWIKDLLQILNNVNIIRLTKGSLHILQKQKEINLKFKYIKKYQKI